MLMKRFIACALCGSMALVLTNVAEAKGAKSSSGGGGPTYGAATNSKDSGQIVGLVPTAHRDGAAGLGG